MGHCLQFLVILLMETFCMTEGTFAQKLYKKMEPGHNIAGLVIAGRRAVSPIQCSRMCQGHNRCAVYQYKGTGPENCLLIQKNCSDANGHIFEDDGNGETYQKVVKHQWSGWREPFCWTGPKVALYVSFDASGGLVLMEGAQQVNSVPLVSGKVNSAWNLDRSKSQWVDLGFHTKTCMTSPEACTAGGAISLWLKIVESELFYGIVSSDTSNGGRTSIVISCAVNGIWFDVNALDGGFSAKFSKPTGWTHIVLNYIGPNDGEGIRVYYDGAEVANDTIKSAWSYSAGDGRIVVGRIYTNRDEDYTSMQIDEMIFFNKPLSTTDIKLLYNAV